MKHSWDMDLGVGFVLAPTVHETGSANNNYFMNVKQTNEKQGHFMDPNFGRKDCLTIIFYLSLFPKMIS